MQLHAVNLTSSTNYLMGMKAKINKLDEIEKRNPFVVPEGYFLKVNDEIMNRLPVKEVSAPKKVSLWKKTQPWIYMAAMFLGAFFIIQSIKQNGGFQSNQPINQTQEFNPAHLSNNYWSNVQISEEEFYQYLEEQLINDGYYDYLYNQISLY